MKKLLKKTKKELLKDLVQLQDKIKEFSFSTTKEAKDSLFIKKTKKQIARILTIINKK